MRRHREVRLATAGRSQGLKNLLRKLAGLYDRSMEGLFGGGCDRNEISEGARAMAGMTPLIQARDAGATLLRTVWDGYGDDGCFQHKLFRNGKELRVAPVGNEELGEAIAALVKEKGMTFDGIMNGSVGIIEVNLVTGEGRFWDAQQPMEVERFAELLTRCEWAGATTVKAEVELSGNEDGYIELSVTAVSSDCWRDRDALAPLFRRSMHRAAYCEAEESLFTTIRRECGSDVSLEVHVPERTFVFSGRGRRVSVKVPGDALEVRDFTVNSLGA